MTTVFTGGPQNIFRSGVTCSQVTFGCAELSTGALVACEQAQTSESAGVGTAKGCIGGVHAARHVSMSDPQDALRQPQPESWTGRVAARSAKTATCESTGGHWPEALASAALRAAFAQASGQCPPVLSQVAFSARG